MENITAMVLALLVGLVLGFLLAKILAGKSASGDDAAVKTPDWWKIRETLTGTQLQILQYMESKKEQTIESLQEKFSFIPDRELFYRLEQISLMGFVVHERTEGNVVYSLNPEYSDTVEDDKTVMLVQE